jgi:hypothetical protein
MARFWQSMSANRSCVALNLLQRATQGLGEVSLVKIGLTCSNCGSERCGIIVSRRACRK